MLCSVYGFSSLQFLHYYRIPEFILWLLYRTPLSKHQSRKDTGIWDPRSFLIIRSAGTWTFWFICGIVFAMGSRFWMERLLWEDTFLSERRMNLINDEWLSILMIPAFDRIAYWIFSVVVKRSARYVCVWGDNTPLRNYRKGIWLYSTFLIQWPRALQYRSVHW